MKTKKANKLIKSILKEDYTEIGIFISLLTYELMKKTDDSRTSIIKRINESLKILESEDK